MIMLSENTENKNTPVIDISASVEKFFKADSPLKDAERFGGRPYEYRKQQSEMGAAVAFALKTRKNLCVEAPTGVGKSFAYLVPAIHYAKQAGKPLIVSTETINLQEQLIEKDIPILQKIMGLDFTATLAKGRSNYVCMRRMGLATGEKREEFLPLSSLMSDVERLKHWASTSDDGSLSSVHFKFDQQLWSVICCEPGNCSGPKCTHYRECFYWKARRKWDKADLIVANHALFFTDLKIRQSEDLENTLLPSGCAVIIDEAHTLEDSAAKYMGLNITNGGIFHFLNRLFNPVNGKGLLVKPGQESMEIRKLVTEILDSSSSFFSIIDNLITDSNDEMVRITKPGFAPDILSEPLARLSKKLSAYIKEQDNEDFKTELESQLARCDQYMQSTYDFINMRLENHVYWVQNKEEGGRGSISLYAAPLNVAEILRKTLFGSETPVVLTSATLSVCRKLDYYKQRVGFVNGNELILDSPFNYQKQVKIYIPKNMPEPNEEAYPRAAAEEIKRFITMTQGKAFVLFTSYSVMHKCADMLESFFSVNNLTLLVQGDEMSRSAMLKEFKRDINSVIFGTTSFWTGVDVPGEALSNVIITKLPFAVPSHPLIQSRSEQIEAQGKNSFMYYSLPDAVLKFRQGTGRLIRSKNDSGIIVILDKRVISKRYGKQFIDSIPKCPVEIC